MFGPLFQLTVSLIEDKFWELPECDDPSSEPHNAEILDSTGSWTVSALSKTYFYHQLQSQYKSTVGPENPVLCPHDHVHKSSVMHDKSQTLGAVLPGIKNVRARLSYWISESISLIKMYGIRPNALSHNETKMINI